MIRRSQRRARDPISRSLLMKRLALSVARNHDADAAQVLGDLVMETYGDFGHVGRYGGVETGRVRLVLFQCNNAQGAAALRESRLLTRSESSFLTDTTARALNSAMFSVPAREAVYNTDHFAKFRDDLSWGQIFTMWIVSKRDIYRAMIAQRVLPPTIRFRELEWCQQVRADQGYQLYLHRVPKGRKKPLSLYLFTVVRQRQKKPTSGICVHDIRATEHSFSTRRPIDSTCLCC